MRRSWRDLLNLSGILGRKDGESGGEIIFKGIRDKEFSDVLTVINPKVKEVLINFRFVETGIYVKNVKLWKE